MYCVFNSHNGITIFFWIFLNKLTTDTVIHWSDSDTW